MEAKSVEGRIASMQQEIDRLNAKNGELQQALEKEKEREAKKESYQLPMIKEEGAPPGPPMEGRFKAQKGGRFERCHPVRTSVARGTWHAN